VWHFARQFGVRMKRNYATITPETMTALCEYEWPGNIRELQNLIERAVILCPGPALRVPLRDLHHRTLSISHTGHAGQHQTLEQAERAHVLRTLREVRWVVGGPKGAAARLGMNRSTLQFRMKKLGIIRPGREDDTAATSQGTARVLEQSLAS
jgi:formate hydrogenlyase transcriptional activator